jgi:hypothetical protein
MSKLYISETANAKLRAFIDTCEYEISGLGKVEELGGNFELVDVVILEQDVTGVKTDMRDNALGKFAFDLQKKGDDISKWNCWWHSHVNMSAYFSGTDTDTIESSNEQRYMVSLVGNKKKEWQARLDIYEPAHATAELDVEVAEPLNEEQSEKLEKQVKELEKVLSKEYGANVKLYEVVEPLVNNKITKLCETQITELVHKPASTLATGKWNKRWKTSKRKRKNKQTPLWELNGMTLSEYNQTYHNLTARERQLVMKAQHTALTPDEEIEVAHLVDMIDNETLSIFDKSASPYPLGY